MSPTNRNQGEPHDGFSGYRIFDLQLQERDKAGAEKTLEALEAHLPGARTDSCRVRFQCTWGIKDAALQGLRNLCFVKDHDLPALYEAAKAVSEANWQREAEAALFRALDEPNVNPDVAALWASSFPKRGAWHHRKRMKKFDPATPAGSKAWGEYLSACGRFKKPQYLSETLRANGKRLRENAWCWGKAGYALVALNQYKEAAKWLRNWRLYEAKPWMLLNAASAMRYAGNNEEAHAINAHALTLPGDETTGKHQLWLACDEAAAGQFDSARERIATARPEEFGVLYQALHALTTAILAVEAAPPQMRRSIYLQNRRNLKQRRYQTAFATASVKGLAKRGVKLMASMAEARPFSLGGGSVRLPSRRVRVPMALGAGVLIILWIGYVGSTFNSSNAPPGSRNAGPVKPMYTPSEYATPSSEGGVYIDSSGQFKFRSASPRPTAGTPAPAGFN
jgi:tetratricopeptide (TPR) repeat protein